MSVSDVLGVLLKVIDSIVDFCDSFTPNLDPAELDFEEAGHY